MHPCPFSGAAAPVFDHPRSVPSLVTAPVDAAPLGPDRSGGRPTAPVTQAEDGRR